VNEPIAPHTVYRWVGPPGAYLNAVPARSLVGADLVELEGREGITPETILQSGLYEPSEWVEIAPFCGAELADGTRCRHGVAAWGRRCSEHEEMSDGTESISQDSDQ